MTDTGQSRSRNALRVRTIERPGWEAPDGRTPGVGERVYCMEGLGKVVRVLGRTGDGTRLLELELDDRPKPPFFAATSNVLVPTEAETEANADQADGDATPEPKDIWLGSSPSAPPARGLKPEE